MKYIIPLVSAIFLSFCACAECQSSGHEQEASYNSCEGEETYQSTGTATFHARISQQPEREYPAGPGSWIKTLDKSSLTVATGAELQMQFAELHVAPGHIRETHWHINSGEWAYVKAGKCDFTLMDNNNNFNNLRAVEGDVWYFPAGWQHYFQAVDPVLGCDLVIWFDKSDVNIDITNTIGRMPEHIIRRSLKDMPASDYERLLFPLYGTNASPTGVLTGIIPDDLQEGCKGKRDTPCNLSLKNWPVFPIKGGIRTETPGAGVQYLLRDTIFPASLTMSGALLELEAGAIREIHWHPNAEEHVYVLQGTISMTVHGVDDASRQQLYNTFTISEGDIGVVPIAYNHYIEAVGGRAVVIVVWNTPNMKQQGLSATFLTTPTHVTETTFDIDNSLICRYFPDDSISIIPPLQEKKDK